MTIRILALALLVLAVLWLPWWLTVFLVLGTTLAWPHFYEALIPAVLFDVLYGAPANRWLPALAATIIVLGLLVLVGRTRTHFSFRRFYGSLA